MPIRNHQRQSRDREHREMTKGGPPTIDFLDPLGAAISTASTNGQSSHVHTTSTTTTGHLPNTLQSKTDEDQLELALALDPHLLGFKPWRELRLEILSNYTTNDMLTIESSFLPSPPPQPPSTIATTTTTTNHKEMKRKRRALVGDEMESAVKFYDLSQEAYVAKMIDIRRILLYLWEKERRLDCIKLICETARLLSTSSPCPQFYPAQFVHVSDLLDIFSQLVYSRLRKRANMERKQLGMTDLPDHFSIDDVLEQTRITARNWFGKIGEIKELLPRLYVEAALLPCMRYMDPTALSVNLMRLCMMCRSLQHPLVAAYIRCYVCRVSMRINPTDHSPHWRCLNDWLQRQQHHQPAVLLRPALEYVIGCVAYGAISQEDLSPLWEYCRLADKRPLVLIAMLNALPPIYLAEHALEATKIVTGSDQLTSNELCALGCNLLRSGAIGQQARKPVLKAVWKCILRLHSLKTYMQCTEVWVEFVAKYFTLNELTVVLDNTLRRLHTEKAEKRGDSAYSVELLSMLEKMVGNTKTVSHLLQLEVMPLFMDLFRDEISRAKSALIVLKALSERHAPGELSDLGLSHLVVELCKRVLVINSSSSSSIDDGVAQIQRALDCFDFTRINPENALSFYVSCRAALLDNDTLQQYTIRRIQELILFVIRNSTRYSSSRSNFLQACLANLFITIPSLDSPLHQLQLTIQSAKLALASMAFLQLDAFIDLALELFKGRLDALQSTGSHFLAFLLTTPIHGALTVYKRFFTTIKAVNWKGTAESTHIQSLFGCLQFLLSYLIGSEGHQWPPAIIMEELEAVTAELDPLLQTDTIHSMELVELISIYVGDGADMPDSLRQMVRDSFKRCKRSSGAFNQRLKRIKATTG